MASINRLPTAVEVPSDYGIDVQREIDSGRLVLKNVDYDTLDDTSLFANHDIVFCTLGTTRSDAGSAVCSRSRVFMPERTLE